MGTHCFTCEAEGTDECSRGGIEQFDVPSKTMAYSFIALYPASFLIYFVSVKKSLCTCRRSRTAANSKLIIVNTSTDRLGCMLLCNMMSPGS